jgi:hypothetical protein
VHEESCCKITSRVLAGYSTNSSKDLWERSSFLLLPKLLLPVLTSDMKWCAGVVHKFKQMRDDCLGLTAMKSLPSLRRKSWEVAVAGGGDAVIDGDFDAACELHNQQIVDLTLEMHAKGVQDEHLLRGCFHPHYDLLQLVQLFLHSTHHHNHHVRLLAVLLVVIPP